MKCFIVNIGGYKMAKYCPECENEILPYLKSDNLRVVKAVNSLNFMERNLISYQLHFCIYCKIVFYEEIERFKFVKLKEDIRNGSKTELQNVKLEKGEDKRTTQPRNKKKDD